jgi:N-methylhydantoinase A
VDLPLKVFERQDRRAIKRLFDAMHELRYGTAAAEEPAEIVSLRSTVTGIMRKPPQERIARGKSTPHSSAFTGRRPVYLQGKFRPTPTYARAALTAGNRIGGPALIEEHAATTLLLPGDRLEVDAGGHLIINVAGGRRE